jgi:transcription termination factor Rho
MDTTSRKLSFTENGIAFRNEEAVTVYRPGRHGAPGTHIEVDRALADDYTLSTGDVLGGTELSDAGTVVGFAEVNGLPLEEARDRPLPRPTRNALERIKPARVIPLTTSPADLTGRLLDLAAPLGMGCAGLIYGPHGTGLTSTLRTVVQGVAHNAPDLFVIVLLTGARGEEVTDWRRRFPTAEIVVCPSQAAGATAEETLLAAELVLECAQRQTELKQHAFLAVDSLTALWAAMLEVEEADAQREADVSAARRSVRDWFQRAGDFGGEGLLGNGLGGSLTVIGTAWHQEIDEEAEEEGESHPHLRLLEHVLNEAGWRVPLSGELAAQRIYPAVDVARCLSTYEQALLPPETYDRLTTARRALSGLSLTERHAKVLEAVEGTSDNDQAVERLLPAEGAEPTEPDPDDFWAGWGDKKG